MGRFWTLLITLENARDEHSCIFCLTVKKHRNKVLKHWHVKFIFYYLTVMLGRNKIQCFYLAEFSGYSYNATPLYGSIAFTDFKLELKVFILVFLKFFDIAVSCKIFEHFALQVGSSNWFHKTRIHSIQRWCHFGAKTCRSTFLVKKLLHPL